MAQTIPPAPDSIRTLKLRAGVTESLKREHNIATDEALARQLGVSRKTLSRVKNGAAVNDAVAAGLLHRFGTVDPYVEAVGLPAVTVSVKP